jgi:hypothetical protein
LVLISFYIFPHVQFPQKLNGTGLMAGKLVKLFSTQKFLIPLLMCPK